MAIIEEITGLTSNWSGELRLETSLRERGTKPFSCAIVLRADLAADESRWRTLIHEVLHSVSTGFLPLDFISNRGWEEGVVEQIQRLIRSEVLVRLGVEVSADLFAAIECNHLFNEYIEVLESVRNGFAADERSFYVELLRTPIKQRYASLQARAMLLQTEDRSRVIRLLSAANVKLTRRIV